MLNKTSSYYKQPRVDFKAFGFDDYTSDYLNDCLMNRDNIEFLIKCKLFDKVSQQSVLHHDQFKEIKVIDDVVRHKRA